MAHIRLHPAPDVRLPITRSVLHCLVLALNHTNSSVFQRLFYKQCFLWLPMAFFCLRGLMAKGANLRPLVHVEDLSFQSRHSCVTSASIVIKGLKHNTSGRPFLVNLESAEDVEFCPANYLKQYSSLRGSARRPLFCLADGVPVKTTPFTLQLCQALIFCGFHCS